MENVDLTMALDEKLKKESYYKSECDRHDQMSWSNSCRDISLKLTNVNLLEALDENS